MNVNALANVNYKIQKQPYPVPYIPLFYFQGNKELKLKQQNYRQNFCPIIDFQSIKERDSVVKQVPETKQNNNQHDQNESVKALQQSDQIVQELKTILFWESTSLIPRSRMIYALQQFKNCKGKIFTQQLSWINKRLPFNKHLEIINKNVEGESQNTWFSKQLKKNFAKEIERRFAQQIERQIEKLQFQLNESKHFLESFGVTSAGSHEKQFGVTRNSKQLHEEPIKKGNHICNFKSFKNKIKEEMNNCQVSNTIKLKSMSQYEWSHSLYGSTLGVKKNKEDKQDKQDKQDKENAEKTRGKYSKEALRQNYQQPKIYYPRY